MNKLMFLAAAVACAGLAGGAAPSKQPEKPVDKAKAEAAKKEIAALEKRAFEEYGRRDFKIPFASLKRYNTITIRQASPGYNKVGTPYLGVNYIVVRKESR